LIWQPIAHLGHLSGNSGAEIVITAAAIDRPDARISPVEI
jgi:hypothetical protein